MFNFFSRKSEPQPLFFATDIHCHVLPGIDDGAPDVDTAVSLVEQMQQWGLKRIIPSPHVTYSTFENTQATTDEAMARLQSALDAKGNGLQLTHSAENRVDDLFERNLEAGTLMTLPGNRLLIENSFIQEPLNLDQVIFDVQAKGYSPILVHPERYSYYYDHKERYEALHHAGAAFQVNVLSLAGHYGKDEKRIAEWLIQRGLVDYLGTDLHRQSHVDSINAYLASKDYLRHRDALPNLQNDKI